MTTEIKEIDLNELSKLIYNNWNAQFFDDMCDEIKLKNEVSILIDALQFLFRSEICSANFCTLTFLEVYKNSCGQTRNIIGYYRLTKEEIKRLRKNDVLKLLKTLDKSDKDIQLKRDAYVKLHNKLYNTLTRRRK